MFPALLILAAGMAAKYMANKGAQDRAQSLQQAMESYQRTKAQQNEAAINQMVAKQTPQARSDELQSIQGSREQSMQDTLSAARAASPVTPAAGATASSDYQKASSTAADLVSARAKRAIEQLGVMGAPGEEGIASGIRFGRAAGAVDAGNNAIANVGAGYGRDINNVQPDPFLSTLGDIGITAGGTMMGGAGGAFAGTAADYATRRRRMNSALGSYGYGDNGSGASYADGYSGGNTRYVDNQSAWQ